jgi:hypothetical protein
LKPIIFNKKNHQKRVIPKLRNQPRAERTILTEPDRHKIKKNKIICRLIHVLRTLNPIYITMNAKKPKS